MNEWVHYFMHAVVKQKMFLSILFYGGVGKCDFQMSSKLKAENKYSACKRRTEF